MLCQELFPFIVKLFKFIIEGNKTKWRTIQEIIGRVISKSDEQAQGELYKVLRFFFLTKFVNFIFILIFFIHFCKVILVAGAIPLYSNVLFLFNHVIV